jgi:hypothetical protein
LANKAKAKTKTKTKTKQEHMQQVSLFFLSFVRSVVVRLLVRSALSDSDEAAVPLPHFSARIKI